MSNAVIGYNNRIDAAVAITDGAWLEALPLANLQDRLFGVVARSASALTSATKFKIDLGAEKVCRTFGILNHNLSGDGKYRIRAGIDGTFATYDFDTGWQEIWPTVYYPEESDFELDTWLEGQYSDEEKAGLLPHKLIDCGSNYAFRYVLVEFDDTLNTDGFVQLGRFFVGEGWQTSINPIYGLALGWEDPSEISTALSGSEDYDEKTKYRVVNFEIKNLPEDEAMFSPYEIIRKSGKTKEILFMQDPDDTLHAIRRQFPARLRELNALEYANVNAHNVPLQAKELI